MRFIFIIFTIILIISCKKNDPEYDLNLKIQTPFRYAHGYAFLYKNSILFDSIWFQGDGSFSGTYYSLPGNNRFNLTIFRLIFPEDTVLQDTGYVQVQWGLFNKILKNESFYFDSLSSLKKSESFNIN